MQCTLSPLDSANTCKDSSISHWKQTGSSTTAGRASQTSQSALIQKPLKALWQRAAYRGGVGRSFLGHRMLPAALRRRHCPGQRCRRLVYFEKAASSSYCSFAQVPSAAPLLSAEAVCRYSSSQHTSHTSQDVLHPPSSNRFAGASRNYVGGQEIKAGGGRLSIVQPCACHTSDQKGDEASSEAPLNCYWVPP